MKKLIDHWSGQAADVLRGERELWCGTRLSHNSLTPLLHDDLYAEALIDNLAEGYGSADSP